MIFASGLTMLFVIGLLGLLGVYDDATPFIRGLTVVMQIASGLAMYWSLVTFIVRYLP